MYEPRPGEIDLSFKIVIFEWPMPSTRGKKTIAMHGRVISMSNGHVDTWVRIRTRGNGFSVRYKDVIGYYA